MAASSSGRRWRLHVINWLEVWVALGVAAGVFWAGVAIRFPGWGLVVAGSWLLLLRMALTRTVEVAEGGDRGTTWHHIHFGPLVARSKGVKSAAGTWGAFGLWLLAIALLIAGAGQALRRW